jgi:ABC-type transport system involved in multi-copper enzyme maturation permease subunit
MTTHLPLLIAAAPEWLVSWITTLWLMSGGVVLGMLGLLLLWGILWLVWRRAAQDVRLVISEGVLLPITMIMGGAVVAFLVGTFLVRQPAALLESIVRLPLAGERTISQVFPPESAMVPLRIDLRGDEAVRLRIDSDEPVEVANAATPEQQMGPVAEVNPGQPFDWTRRTQSISLFAGRYVENLYVTNQSDRNATVTVLATTGPAYPEVKALPATAVAVLGLYLLYFIQAWAFPKVSAIALATTKSEIAQPLFGILLALGAFLLLLFLFLPYNTFGEDIKMLKDSGLTLIMVMGIIQGVWAASNSISEEIDGRTALTVLSKPIGRRQFIFGKLAGILWTVGLLFLVLGIIFLVVVAYKPVYDAREMGSETPDWTVSHLEVMLTIPGLILAFFEVIVLVSLSVAISTRLPMLANFVICFSIYVLGHITPLLVQSSIQFAPVVFIGQLIATILPVLDHFNIQAAVAAGRPVPPIYLVWAFVYCLLYSGIAMLLALVLFEDRDLA